MTNDNELTRFSVSMEAGLLRRFDERWPALGVATRSEAVRELIRHFLVQEDVRAEGRIMAVLLYVYDHHVRETSERIIALQHDFEAVVVVTMHAHISHHECLEVALVQGPMEQLNALKTAMRGVRGIHRLELIPAIGHEQDDHGASQPEHAHKHEDEHDQSAE